MATYDMDARLSKKIWNLKQDMDASVGELTDRMLDIEDGDEKEERRQERFTKRVAIRCPNRLQWPNRLEDRRRCDRRDVKTAHLSKLPISDCCSWS